MALTKDSAAGAPALRNLAVALAAIAVLIWSMSGGAAAETAYSFDVTPGKLPKTVVPPMPGSGSTATGMSFCELNAIANRGYQRLSVPLFLRNDATAS